MKIKINKIGRYYHVINERPTLESGNNKIAKVAQKKRFSLRIVKNTSSATDAPDKKTNLLKRKHKREWIKRGLNCNWTVSEVSLLNNEKDNLLKEAVRKNNAKNWKNIARHISVN